MSVVHAIRQARELFEELKERQELVQAAYGIERETGLERDRGDDYGWGL